MTKRSLLNVSTFNNSNSNRTHDHGETGREKTVNSGLHGQTNDTVMLESDSGSRNDTASEHRKETKYVATTNNTAESVQYEEETTSSFEKPSSSLNYEATDWTVLCLKICNNQRYCSVQSKPHSQHGYSLSGLEIDCKNESPKKHDCSVDLFFEQSKNSENDGRTSREPLFYISCESYQHNNSNAFKCVKDPHIQDPKPENTLNMKINCVGTDNGELENCTLSHNPDKPGKLVVEDIFINGYENDPISIYKGNITVALPDSDGPVNTPSLTNVPSYTSSMNNGLMITAFVALALLIFSCCIVAYRCLRKKWRSEKQKPKNKKRR
ncbi:hypothetical protein THOM_1122 [Trachipleistophora hominis]|uniref:Uncharacterized protein n=1 Tax=Trachipleistophora hominis TaxID=72359 RepID=L7JWV6_TRAHO|nr:hypothetical protein THOM_1122 [Trachipleistophora hominis]